MQYDEQFNKMTKTPIPRLVTMMSVPTILSMLISSIYNMADTFFVSQLGTSASGAVGIVFSLMAIIQAIGFTFAMGAGSLISRKLGEQDKESASKYAATAFYESLATGILITVFGLFFLDNLMSVLGATETILPYAKDYALYILFAAPVMCASFVLNNILRAEGKAVFSMCGMMSGGILNIILDPIFIFGFGMGIAGAAIATLIGQVVGFIVMLTFFIFRKSITNISIKNFSGKIQDTLEILKIGFPSLCRQGLASIATVALNNQAAFYGDAAVAAFSIVGRIFMFFLSFALGIGQGFQPVAGYNFGAKMYDRVKKSFIFTVVFSFILMGFFSAICFIFAPQVIGFFRNDVDVIEIGEVAIKFQCVVMPFLAVSVTTNMLYQSIGKSGIATFLSCNRQGLYFLPLIILLPYFFGILGIQMTQMLADVLSVITCIPFIVFSYRQLITSRKAEQK